MPLQIAVLDHSTVTGKAPCWFDDLKPPMDDEEVYGPIDAPENISAGSTVCVHGLFRGRVTVMSTRVQR